MHLLVDVDTKKILAVRVTGDRTGDSPMFIPLLDDTLENCVPRTSESDHAGGSTRCSAYGDGAYASRDNLKACRDRNVTPLIKLKVSSTPKGKGAVPDDMASRLMGLDDAVDNPWNRVGDGTYWIRPDNAVFSGSTPCRHAIHTQDVPNGSRRHARVKCHGMKTADRVEMKR